MNWSNLKTYGALTLVSLFYGVNYSVLKVVIPEHIHPYGFVSVRVVIATLIFWLFYVFNQEKIDWKTDGIKLTLCAFTGVCFNMLMFYKGISLTTAVNGSIIMTLTPILVLIWAYFLLGEKITRFKIVGILIALIGAVIIVYQPSSSLTMNNWRGDVFVLLNGATYALYLVLVKPLMKKYKPMTVVTWIFTIGVLMVLPFGFKSAVQLDVVALPLKVWYSIAYAILITTVLVYFLNAWSLSKVNSSVVGAFIYLQPVFATVTAIFFFEEVFLLKHLIATLFIFLGVWMVTKK